MAWPRAALALLAAGAAAAVVLSGGSPADPRTPPALPGLPPPFLGTAVVGSGGLAAAVDSYGDVVDLWAPGPAGRAQIDNPVARQAAGTVAPTTGVVPRISVEGGPATPFWRADAVVQRYLPGTGAVRTVARFGPVRVAIADAAAGPRLVRLVDVDAPRGVRVAVTFGTHVGEGIRCTRPPQALVCAAGSRSASDPERIVAAAIAADRRWLARARPLAAPAPAWARRLYRRSLLVLRALTDARSGAVAAGARDGWAYAWPRDAGAAALALAAAGYRPEARSVARFLRRLDLGAAARFHGDGTAVPGREAQGDASGWAAVAARAAGLPPFVEQLPWRDRADYQEGAPGTYLANAVAAMGALPVDGPKTPLYGGKSAHRPGASEITAAFGTARGLVREAGDAGSGLDSGAAWAVRPFPRPALFPAVRRTLLRLAEGGTRFGIAPGEDWPGTDPWTAPTAWTAWSLAALADRARREGATGAAGVDRRAALRLLAALRRAATPAGALPERVDVHTGVPRSTTPLAWSHAFAILALRQLWP